MSLSCSTSISEAEADAAVEAVAGDDADIDFSSFGVRPPSSFRSASLSCSGPNPGIIGVIGVSGAGGQTFPLGVGGTAEASTPSHALT